MFPLLVAGALAVALAPGCSSSGSVGKTVGGWFGSDSSATAKQATKTLYVRTDGVAVHAEAKDSSKSVASLDAGEKVSRRKVSGAWAYVEARGGRVKGWVPAAQLGSRPAAAAGAPGQPAAATATETEATTNEAAESSGDSSEATVSDEQEGEEAAAEEANGETPEAAAAPAPAPVEEPAGPKPAPAKKGKVAPSVFDPY